MEGKRWKGSMGRALATQGGDEWMNDDDGERRIKGRRRRRCVVGATRPTTLTTTAVLGNKFRRGGDANGEIQSRNA